MTMKYCTANKIYPILNILFYIVDEDAGQGRTHNSHWNGTERDGTETYINIIWKLIHGDATPDTNLIPGFCSLIAYSVQYIPLSSTF